MIDKIKYALPYMELN